MNVTLVHMSRSSESSLYHFCHFMWSRYGDIFEYFSGLPEKLLGLMFFFERRSLKGEPKPCIVIKLHEIKRFIRKFWLIKVLMDQYTIHG